MISVAACRRLQNSFTALILSICLAATFAAAQRLYDEPWRPQYHFTPPQNFMNDPNGLVYYQGEYHLFYQHNPQGPEWGHMSWGHATSDDMLHWRNLPLAIPKQPAYMIYSGSAVVDWHNTSGLCRGADPRDPSCLAAIYTAASSRSQAQNLAFSNDRGRTWTNYAGNPVADLQQQPDFRDPKVFWYELQKKWVMVAVFADEKQLKILDSPDLKKWTLRSTFGPLGAAKGQWECPDLFELPLDSDAGRKKWVLVINRNPGAPAGGTGVEYFVGNFDGFRFTKEGPAEQELWADYGKDFYATNSFSDLPASDGRRIWLAWISNWQYANTEPTKLWRGAQSLPRALSLKTYPEGIRLLQTPVKEIERLRASRIFSATDIAIQHDSNLRLANDKSDTLEIEAELVPGNAAGAGFRLRKGENEETLVGVSAKTHELFIDRTHSGLVSFSPDFPGRHRAILHWTSPVKLHIFLDRSSIEVFANDGETVLTDRIYPSPASNGLEVYSEAGDSRIRSLTVWKLNSIWK